MATKGPSNRYGNSRGGRQGHITERTGFAWAKGFNKKILLDHFERHGAQMNSDTISSYVAHAVKFANTIDRKNCVSFIDNMWSTHKYNKKTNEYVIVTKDGYIVTYYKPTASYKYYIDQKKKKGK